MSTPPSLSRTLTLRDLSLLTIGTVIGSGIFLTPAGILRDVAGFPALALLVWIAGGILSLLGALTYGELTAARPHTGGLYVFIRDCFGPLPAFLFGWTLFFVISTGTVATLAVAFTTYLQELIPVSPWQQKAIAVFLIAVMAAVNIRGTRQSADLNNWATATKVVAILAMSVALIYFGRGWNSLAGAAWPPQVSTSLFSGFGAAMISVLWAYEGWQWVTYSAGEVKNPQRTFPRGLFLGTLALTAIYVLANVAYISALGPAAPLNDRIAAVAVSTVLSPAAAKLLTIAILISVFSAANSSLITAPRVFYAMAHDRVFFKSLAKIHPRYNTPAFAIAASSLWAAVLALSGTFNQLLAYVVFGGWLFYGLAAACVFVYRRRLHAVEGRGFSPAVNEPPAKGVLTPEASPLPGESFTPTPPIAGTIDRESPQIIYRSVRDLPYRVPGYPLTPILFILSAVAIIANNLFTDPRGSAIGLAIIALGLPAFLLWRRQKSQT